MADFSIDRFDGTQMPVEIDQSTTKIQAGINWVGQYYSTWGEIILENFLHLNENFAGPNKPSSFDDSTASYNKLRGQTWFNTNDVDQEYQQTLFVQTDIVQSNNDGWKRLTPALSTRVPTKYTFGDIWINTTEKTLSYRDGAGWQDLAVNKAKDSDRVGGLLPENFLRSDIDDTANGTLSTSNLIPRSTNTYNIGQSSARYSRAYIGLLDTNTSLDLNPDQNNLYNLGNSDRKWNNIYVRTVKADYFTDIIPEDNNIYSVGVNGRIWKQGWFGNLKINTVNTLMPESNNGGNIGSPDTRWNNLFISVLNTGLVDSDLIPNFNNQYMLGNASNRWKSLDVELIKSTRTEHLVPMGNANYDLGGYYNRYHTLFADNINGINTSDATTNMNGTFKYGTGDSIHFHQEHTNGDSDLWTIRVDAPGSRGDPWGNLVFQTSDDSGEEGWKFRFKGNTVDEDVLIIKRNRFTYRGNDIIHKGNLKEKITEIGGLSSFRGFVGIPAAGVAPFDMIVTVISYRDTHVYFVVDGVMRGQTAKRDKYGTGTTTTTVAVHKGASYQIVGGQTISAMRVGD